MSFPIPDRKVTRVFLHCSASDDASLKGLALVSEIKSWHIARGFNTIGYHFVIDKLGQVLPGRHLERSPAAQAGHNMHTIAICVHGLAVENFTDAAKTACRNLCDQINQAYKGRVTFHGHCEVSAKTCPVFDYRGLLQLDEAGKMPLPPQRTKQAVA